MNKSSEKLCPLPFARSFYDPSAEVVASRLLGHFLIRSSDEGICGGPIVETEAYLENDPACHAFRGLTKRNRVMFGQPGHAYVYFIYGCHYCVNVVCRPPGTGEAVLIRAIEPALGEHLMQTNRHCATLRQLTNGPGKLCQAMKIDRSLDGADLCDPAGPLYIIQNPEHRRFMKMRKPIAVSPRIGLTQGQAPGHLLRFFLTESVSVSGRTRGKAQTGNFDLIS